MFKNISLILRLHIALKPRVQQICGGGGIFKNSFVKSSTASNEIYIIHTSSWFSFVKQLHPPPSKKKRQEPKCETI